MKVDPSSSSPIETAASLPLERCFVSHVIDQVKSSEVLIESRPIEDALETYISKPIAGRCATQVNILNYDESVAARRRVGRQTAKGNRLVALKGNSKKVFRKIRRPTIYLERFR